MTTKQIKVSATKNYRLFERSHDNRDLDLKKHIRLKRSMLKYGFLKCYPVVCYRDRNKKLIVKDGQHRLAIAEELGLPVYWMEVDDSEFDVAVVNSTPKTWQLIDYARKYSANGKKDYTTGLELADRYRLPMGLAFALLGGTTSYGNIAESFVSGSFKVKDSAWAEAVGSLYSALIGISKEVKNARCLEACMAICRVENFDASRLLHGANRCREKLTAYSTRDSYLEMMEEIYNFNRASKNLFGLKIAAIQVMRERNVVNGKKK